MKIKEEDKVVGFPLIEDGWHNAEINKADYRVDEETQTATEVYIVQFKVVGDEDEGKGISMFCDLDKKFWRTQLAKIIGFSGFEEVLVQKHKNLDASLNPDQWGEKYLTPASKSALELIPECTASLPGRFLRIKVETTMAKSKKTGKDAQFQNVRGLDWGTAPPTTEASFPEKGAEEKPSEPEEEEW